MAPVVYEVGSNFCLCFFGICQLNRNLTPTPKKKTLLSNKWKKTKLYNEGPVRWALVYTGSYGPFEKNENQFEDDILKKSFSKLRDFLG